MKQELQEKIIELETTLNELRSQVAAMPDEGAKWVPNEGQELYVIAGNGHVYVCKELNNNSYAKECIALGNCYPTELAAIDAREWQDFIRGALSNQAKPTDLSNRFYIDLKHEWVESHGGFDVVRDRLARGWV